MPQRIRFAVLGLSITSSWGNGHATTYRALLQALARRGHEVIFLERDREWYAAHRDLGSLPGVDVALYRSVEDLHRFAGPIRAADVVIIGSFVPDGREIARTVRRWTGGLLAFYDIDTPVTLAALEDGDRCEYLSRALLADYDLYLSFTGGPALSRLTRIGARVARPLYCGVEPAEYRPVDTMPAWDLGYLGTYAADRQPALERLLLQVARQWSKGRFVVGGPLYPPDLVWPPNVERREHVAPGDHRLFYGRQRFTLNLTRADMRRLGYSPSVRLFEAAACGAAILTDNWAGLEEFFEPGREIVRVRTATEVRTLLADCSEPARAALGRRARQRVLASHTAAQRAATLEGYVQELTGTPVPVPTPLPATARGGALPLAPAGAGPKGDASP